MTTQQQNPVDVTRGLLTAADTDLPAFFATFTDDCRFRMGNGEVVVGRGNIQAWAGEALASVRALRHDVHEEFVDGDVVVLLVDVGYTMASGAQFTLPAAVRARVRDGQVSECQFVVDASPVAAAS